MSLNFILAVTVLYTLGYFNNRLTEEGIMKRTLLVLLLFILSHAEIVSLSKITVEGNRKTKKSTILQIAKLDSLSTQCDIDTVQQLILNRQLFAKVEVTYDSNSKELFIKI